MGAREMGVGIEAGKGGWVKESEEEDISGGTRGGRDDQRPPVTIVLCFVSTGMLYVP